MIIQRKQSVDESGFTLIAVMILLLLSTFLISNLHDTTQSDIRSAYSIKKRSQRYYDAENTLHRVASWMRENSNVLLTHLTQENFYSHYDRTPATPGDNDSVYFSIPTRLKIQNTNNSVVLSNNAILSSSTFPDTEHIISGATFSSQTEFAAQDFGNSYVRVTLIDAIGIDTTKDFGDPDSGNPVPETDFQPVYRIDVLTGLDRGAHVYAYFIGALHYSPFIGFYGEDQADISRDCDSYESDVGGYSVTTNRLAGCTTGSQTLLRHSQTTTVYGAATSKGSISASGPWGGDVCADFASGCPTAGESCAGDNCDVISFMPPVDWDTFCTTHQGDFIPPSSQSLSLGSASPSDSCWNSITINAGVTLTLTTSSTAYYVKQIVVQPGGILRVNPSVANSTITLITDSIAPSNELVSSSWINSTKPYQFSLWYLGTDALNISTASSASLFIQSPHATTIIDGAGDFFGSVRAKSLIAQGSGELHFDESAHTSGILSDVRYVMRSIGQELR